jgi:diguanylate cyclase (GGDEF)-like protein/PAS domain S-box-containing protein
MGPGGRYQNTVKARATSWLRRAAVTCAALIAVGAVAAMLSTVAARDPSPMALTALVMLTLIACSVVLAIPMRSRIVRMAQDEIRSHEERFRLLVEQSPVVVYIDALDESASTLYISPRIEQLTGYKPKEWREDPDLWPKLLHPEDRERALALTARHNETGEPFMMEYRMVTRDGGTIWVRDEAIMVKRADGSFLHSQGVLTDVTAEKEAEARIEYLAYHDGLTGLPNQAMFTQLAQLALARANRGGLSLAVLSLDLDGFKLVNDTLGMERGDELLRAVAQRLQETIRETDTIARRGADEFLLLLADLERGEVGDMHAPLLFAESVAGRIRDALARSFEVGGTEVFVTASIGISLYPDDAEDVPTLMIHSESAMIASRRSGPGKFAVSDVSAVDSATKFSFVQKLRRAVERSEWQLHYQPIVELATGAIKGVEALIRWRAENGELIAPNEFIPLAEELGLIEAIGDWVVDEIVRQDETWRREDLTLEMGFNLSPRQFWQPDLAERILGRLAERRMDPRQVVVEVTETSAMRDPDRAQAILWDLHSRGLRLALDDFGTGYSSLWRLRNLPVDVLKIDRSFVSRVDTDPQAAKIVAAFIQLGQGLGMTTLAEGIETEGEWRFLAEQGCELGQGFYFSRPVPAEVISERFRAGELVPVGS